jgi:hypothetical protein
MEVVPLTRETEWMVFEKAVEVTASAVRGAMGGQGSQPASYVGEVFKEAYRALREAAEQLPDKDSKAGF